VCLRPEALLLFKPFPPTDVFQTTLNPFPPRAIPTYYSWQLLPIPILPFPNFSLISRFFLTFPLLFPHSCLPFPQNILARLITFPLYTVVFSFFFDFFICQAFLWEPSPCLFLFIPCDLAHHPNTKTFGYHVFLLPPQEESLFGSPFPFTALLCFNACFSPLANHQYRSAPVR